MRITPRWVADREYAHRRCLRRLAARERTVQKMPDPQRRAASLLDLAVLRKAYIEVRSYQRDLERQLLASTQKLALRRRRRLSRKEIGRLTKRHARLLKQLERTRIENLTSGSWALLRTEATGRIG